MDETKTYDPKAINRMHSGNETSNEGTQPKSPEENELIRKKEEKAARKKMKKEKKTKRRKLEEHNKHKKNGSPVTGWDEIMDENEAAIESTKKKSKKKTKGSTKANSFPNETAPAKTSPNNEKTPDSTTTDEHVVQEQCEQPNNEASKHAMNNDDISNQTKKKKKKNNTTTKSNDVEDKTQNNTTSEHNYTNKSSTTPSKRQTNKSNKSPNSNTNTKKSTPSKKASPLKTPTQKSTLKDFNFTPTKTASTPFGKNHSLTKTEIAQAIDIQNEREAQYTVHEIMFIDDTSLKRDHIAHNSPFQQAIVLSTILYEKAIKIIPDIPKDLFAQSIVLFKTLTLLSVSTTTTNFSNASSKNYQPSQHSVKKHLHQPTTRTSSVKLFSQKLRTIQRKSNTNSKPSRQSSHASTI